MMQNGWLRADHRRITPGAGYPVVYHRTYVAQEDRRLH
jgi:hypothetical protein